MLVEHGCGRQQTRPEQDGGVVSWRRRRRCSKRHQDARGCGGCGGERCHRGARSMRSTATDFEDSAESGVVSWERG